MGDVVVCDSARLSVSTLSMSDDGSVSIWVLVVCLWVLENDVPCMKQTWDVPQAAKGDVDKRISRADADLNPDYRFKQAETVSIMPYTT